ncbi:MAG TPA: signal peptidase I [Candidatus Oscillibacter excrementigallinarum]|uniref:Signal peptidase I n=1 Tax=Candidatus Oscillibacter excrementigallinarum TaxID=2838716 RepID=A0A9D2LI30_9FIRM|nr:signal peptidase I [Candidatus Oscillibacter excrementigallinarum]
MQGGKRLSRDAVPFRWLYEWVQALVTVVLCAVVVFAFAARLVLVSGPSMRETLQDQDCLVVLNPLLCGSFDAGDIVIIRRETFRDGEPIVKRIIATEGQTVDIDFDAGVVYVDGAALEEDYIRQPTCLEEGLEFPCTVPEGCVFVMGDNRNDSDDSRDPDLGPVDTREILGQAVFLLYPGMTAGTWERDLSRIGPLV